MEKNTTPSDFKGQRNMEHHAQAKHHSQYTKFLKLRDLIFFAVVAHFCCLPSYNVYEIYLIFISLVLL